MTSNNIIKKSIAFLIPFLCYLNIKAQTCQEKISYALEFNGVNQYAVIPDRAALNAPGSAAITIEMWIRPNDITTNTFYSIYRKENDGVGRQIIAFQNDNVAGTVAGVTTTTSLSFGMHTIASGYQELDVLINPANFENKWNHIAATYDGAAMRLYVNSTEIGNKPALNLIQQPNVSRAVFLGSFDGAHEFYNGRIDQVRMWSIALNSTQINAIKDSCTDFATLSATADTTKLHTYLKFEDNGLHLNDEVFATNITRHNSPKLNLGFYTDEFKANVASETCGTSGLKFVVFQFYYPSNWLNGFSSIGGAVNRNDNLVIRPNNPAINISGGMSISGTLTSMNGGLGSSCTSHSYSITPTGIFIQNSPNFIFTINSNNILSNFNIFRLTDNANMKVGTSGRINSYHNSKTYLESTKFVLNGTWAIRPGAEIYTTPSFAMSGTGNIHSTGIFKNTITFPLGISFYINESDAGGGLFANSIGATTFEDNANFIRSNLFFDIASINSFDKMTIANKGKFDAANLNVNLTTSDIKAGDRFKIIEATNGFSLTNFDNINLPPEYTWDIEYNPNDITLVVTGCTGTDTQAPQILTELNDITVGLTNNHPIFTIPDYTTIEVTDNCDLIPTITQTPTAGTLISASGTQTITLTTTDASGNSSQKSFVLKVLNIIPKTQTLTGATTITCPQDNTLTLESSETDYNYLLSKSEVFQTAYFTIYNKEFIDTKITGTGGALNFNTGVVNGKHVQDRKTGPNYEVFAANPSYALEFDGIDDYVEIPHNNAVSFTDKMTIEAWVYPTDLTANNGFQEIYRKDNAGTGRILLSFQDNGTTLVFGLHTATDPTLGGYKELDVTINSAEYTNQWVHIMATYDGTHMYLYRNGEEIGKVGYSGNIITPPVPSPAYIGSFNGTTEFFQGKIAAFRIWDKAIIQSVTDTYGSPELAKFKEEVLLKDVLHNFYTGEEANIKTYYPFFENFGSQLNDATANASNGIINGASWTTGTTGGVGKIVSNEHRIEFNAELYVDINATGNKTGCDWANAFTHIQDAVNTIGYLGTGVIHIAEGTYNPGTNYDLYINIIDKTVTFIGGYPTGGGERNATMHPTIIRGSGTLTPIGIVTSGGANNSRKIVIKGLTIQNFKRGIEVENLYIEDSTIEQCKKVGVSVSGNLTMINSKVINNINKSDSDNNAAGIIGGTLTLINSLVHNNTTEYTVQNYTGTKKSGFTKGGGIYCNSATLINSMVSNNTTMMRGEGYVKSYSYGGGIYAENTVELINSSIINNLAIARNYTYGMHLESAGGGIYAAGDIVLKNSLLWNNIRRTIKNNSSVGGLILETTDTPSETTLVNGATLTTDYSLIDSKNPTGTGNIDATTSGFNPLFVDEATGDYRLQAGSPLINVGLDSYTTTQVDLDNNPRFINTIDIGPYEFNGATNANTSWTGATNTLWQEAGNWNSGIPDSNSNVTIPAGLGNYPAITNTNNATAFNVDNKAGASISINAGKGLSIGNDLTNNGNITIHSDATSSGALVVQGTASGTITYNRQVTDNWHTVGAPVIGQSINEFATTNTAINQVIKNSDNTKYAIAPYNNDIPSSNWEYLAVANIATAGDFINGKGYAMKRATPGTYTFVGTIENNDKTIGLTDGSHNNWNLIANPYPSFIAFNDLANASQNLLIKNTAVLKNDYLAIYIWDVVTSSYKPYNHASTNLQYLAPGQAFFVNAKDGGGSFIFDKNLQHYTGNLFAKNKSTVFEMSIQLFDGKKTKSTAIKYLPNTTKDLDIGYDARAFSLENPSFGIYTHLLENSDNNPYALQCLAPTNFEEQIIPIGISVAKDAEISFSVVAKNTLVASIYT